MPPGGKNHNVSSAGMAREGPVEDLPLRALSRPRDTARVAERMLAATRDPYVRSYAGQALGIATREMGDVAQAVRYLRAALAAATSCGDERSADVEASLGITLAFAGRSKEALRHLDAALSQASGVTAARVRVRRGVLLGILGRTSEEIAEHRRAARTLGAAGDSVREARALNNLGLALIDRGDAPRAEDALTRAEALLADAGQTFDAANVRSNRGLVASLYGQVPEALAHYDAAEIMYADAGVRSAELSEVRCSALLAVGLYDDALRHGQEAVGLLRSQGAAAAYRADALVRTAQAALAADDPKIARAYATEAVRLFRRQGRGRGETLARLTIVRARFTSGERNRRLLHDAARLAAAADRHRMAEAVEAHLLTAQVALALGDAAAANPHLLRTARARSRGSALNRVIGWHAAALRAEAAGNRRALFAACERGLQVIDAYQLTLGAVEMRAAATTHGTALTTIAVREALAADDPALLLRWTERWRARTFAIPPVRPPDDDEFAAKLAMLRQITRHINQARVDERPVAALERERRRLEDEVRGHSLRTSGIAAETDAQHLDIDGILAALGETRLVEIVRVEDRIHILIATSAGVRRYVAGTWDSAVHAADSSRFILRRLAYRMRPEPMDDARRGIRSEWAQTGLAALETLGTRLQEQILAAAVDDLGEGPLVIVPPAALHPVPWGLLPALADRAVTVAPSALAWLHARRIEPPSDRTVAVVVGPGLKGAEDEAVALADRYADAEILTAGMATAEKVLSALDGAWLAHIAAHSTFRADNPMFSSILLDDGPLTVHDFERLGRAPYQMVLAGCDSGVAAPVGADELLGLVSSLGPLGAAGIVASVVPVNDIAAVPLMLALHDALRRGAPLPEALQAARQAAGDDPLALATAHSFVALGA